MYVQKIRPTKTNFLEVFRCRKKILLPVLLKPVLQMGRKKGLRRLNNWETPHSVGQKSKGKKEVLNQRRYDD